MISDFTKELENIYSEQVFKGIKERSHLSSCFGTNRFRGLCEESSTEINQTEVRLRETHIPADKQWLGNADFSF